MVGDEPAPGPAPRRGQVTDVTPAPTADDENSDRPADDAPGIPCPYTPVAIIAVEPGVASRTDVGADQADIATPIPGKITSRVVSTQRSPDTVIALDDAPTDAVRRGT